MRKIKEGQIYYLAEIDELVVVGQRIYSRSIVNGAGPTLQRFHIGGRGVVYIVEDSVSYGWGDSFYIG